MTTQTAPRSCASARPISVTPSTAARTPGCARSSAILRKNVAADSCARPWAPCPAACRRVTRTVPSANARRLPRPMPTRQRPAGPRSRWAFAVGRTIVSRTTVSVTRAHQPAAKPTAPRATNRRIVSREAAWRASVGGRACSAMPARLRQTARSGRVAPAATWQAPVRTIAVNSSRVRGAGGVHDRWRCSE
jgi:hypothetical protein